MKGAEGGPRGVFMAGGERICLVEPVFEATESRRLTVLLKKY